MLRITPKNWQSFQHYGNRKPPWIKLHRTLLDDFAFASLPIASKALAPCLWLLASEKPNAVIEATIDEIAFRVRMGADDVKIGLKHLIEKGFFIDASGVLADSLQDARPEKEREKEKDINNKYIPSRSLSLAGFDEFWLAYPRKIAKGSARKAWAAAIKKQTPEVIIETVKRYKWSDNPEYIPHPASWLNGERWEDSQNNQAAKQVLPIISDEERIEWLRNFNSSQN